MFVALLHPSRLLVLAALFLWGLQLHAQQSPCNRVGLVVEIDADCGATIIDLDAGQVIQAVGNISGLEIWKTIRFGSAPAIIPQTCSPEGTPVVLTCISDTLPCVADFNYLTHDENAFRHTFQADVYDPSTQSCLWNFGDGSSATGAVVEHIFAQEGYFNVCLTVTDPLGCSAQYCQNLFVDAQNPNWCGFDIQVTTVNNQLQGTLYPTNASDDQLLDVQWFLHKSNQILSTERTFNYELPGEGNYLVCAQFTSQSSKNNSLCNTTRCQQVTLTAPGCFAPTLVNPTALCPMLLAPVCGCNGITYINECEAMSAGATGWWTGPCNSTTGACNADLGFKILSGGLDTSYTVRFYNLSTGTLQDLQLDFGDGTPIVSNATLDSIDHVYEKGGIYRANLAAWNQAGCVASITKLVITDSYNNNSSQLPGGTDYVWPGDANGDSKANVYDLLNIGVLYHEKGAPRPGASPDWKPQFAPNWHSALGVNSKHSDCDGDGTINDFDTDPIEIHYAPIDATPAVELPGAPPVYLDFVADTIAINPQSTDQFLEIEADVMVGTPVQPAMGLYGIAMGLAYPDYVEHDPEADYPFNNLFGHSNHVLWLPKDNYSKRQLDLGFVRKNSQAVSGYGRIARIRFRADYIIIVDIIGRESKPLTPFSVKLGGLKAIDQNGEPLQFSIPAVADTVWFYITTKATDDIPGSELVRVSPNPATTEAQVFTGDLTINSIDVVNNLGQLVLSRSTPTSSRIHTIPVAGWIPGVYSIRITTPQGIVSRKLTVK